MSIIGHSIQGSIANVHAALKDQQAGQAAVSAEDAQRHARVRREEELAREAVQQTLASRQGRVHNPPDGRREQGEKRKDESDGQEAPAEGNENKAAGGGHIDLLA